MKTPQIQTPKYQRENSDSFWAQKFRLLGNAELAKDYPSVKKFIRKKSKIVLTYLLICLLVAVWPKSVVAQNNINEVWFVNPLTNEKLKLEAGEKVMIEYKVRNVKITGIILNFSDSTLILATGQEQRFVAFRDVAQIASVARMKRKYMATVTLLKGRKLVGQLVRTKTDSVGIWYSRSFQIIRLNPSDIKSIRVRGKRFLGKAIAIGAGIGGIIGGVAASGAFESNQNKQSFYNETDKFAATFQGVVTGALSGLVAGAIVGLYSRNYIIEGDSSRFKVFSDAYRNAIPLQK